MFTPRGPLLPLCLYRQVTAGDIVSLREVTLGNLLRAAGTWSVCYNYQGRGWLQVESNITVTGATNFDILPEPAVGNEVCAGGRGMRSG